MHSSFRVETCAGNSCRFSAYTFGSTDAVWPLDASVRKVGIVPVYILLNQLWAVVPTIVWSHIDLIWHGPAFFHWKPVAEICGYSIDIASWPTNRPSKIHARPLPPTGGWSPSVCKNSLGRMSLCTTFNQIFAKWCIVRECSRKLRLRSHKADDFMDAF